MKGKVILFLYSFLFLTLLSSSVLSEVNNEQIYTLSGKAQGTSFFIRYRAIHPSITQKEVMDILDDLDSSLSLYKSYSLINQFNAAEKGIIADHHLLNVVKKSIEISKQSAGCFDITVKPLLNLWGFHASQEKKIPSLEQIQKTLREVGYQNLMIKDSSLFKNDPGLSIDCDGIAQGYSVDVLAGFLDKKNVKDYQIELGGEVRTKGSSLENTPWMTKFEMLDDKGHPIEGNLRLRDEAVTTSGSFSKFSKLGGKYFSHVIDPRTGKPVNNGVIAVSVIHADAMTADGWDNAFMVMGYKKAIAYANSLSDVGVYMIYRKKDGQIADTANAYFNARIIPSVVASPRWQ